MSEISIQGNVVYYREGESFDKSRPTLLFIHGAGQSSATWMYQLDEFRGRPYFNLLAPDLPGRGGSQGTAFKTVDENKNFLYEFIRSLELDNVIVIGHSMGGGIAMKLALEHPEIVTALVLVATGAKLSVAQQTLETVKSNYEEFCELASTRMFAEGSPDQLKQDFKNGLLQTGQEVCYADLIACNQFNILNKVDKISAPTLIVSSDKDVLTPFKYGEYLHQKIYGSDFIEIKDSGHFIMQEKPQEFNQIFSDFLIDFNK